MSLDDPIPTSIEVVRYLNERFEILGLPYRIEQIDVLPYQNPMWLANWDVPQLAEAPERQLIERELREARWKFPQVRWDG
ncbi:MAG TPA: hypothetical protein VMT00_02195 [Thermoanaerobaculia bacterium]|nr:hypothetical protein [Thermoanaerobaculia bacterium]